jgi:DNA end-binding protein Ku
LAALRPYEGVLLLETMYYSDEVRKPDRVNGSTRLQKAEVDMADPAKYDDTYRKELLDLIRKKAKGAKLPEPREEDEAEVVDLMAALRESVKETHKGRKRKKAARKAS